MSNFPTLADEAEMDRQALLKSSQESTSSTTISNINITSSSSQIRVFVVRHAERADECGKAEKLMRQKSAEKKAQNSIHRADSLLTENGLSQAQLCAQVVRQRIPLPVGEISEKDLPVIYTSPLCRCAQTASYLAQEFQVPIRPIASLGQCALAIQRAGLPLAVSSIYQSSEALSRICNNNIGFLDRIDDINHNFLQGVEHLVFEELQRNKEEKRDVIIVAHREAFYGQLFQRTGEKLPYKPPYCCIGEFVVSSVDQDTSTNSIAQMNDEQLSHHLDNQTKSSNNRTLTTARQKKLASNKHSEQHIGNKDLLWQLVEFDVGYTVQNLKPAPTTGPTSGYPRAKTRTFNQVGLAAQESLNQKQVKDAADQKKQPLLFSTP